MFENAWGTGVILPSLSPRAAADAKTAAWWARFERQAMSRGTAMRTVGDFMCLDVRPVMSAVQASVLVVQTANSGPPTVLSDALDNCNVIEVEHTDMHWWWDNALANTMLDAVQTHFTGRPVVPDADRVLATVLFTDIVDSTARAAEVGDRRWAQLLEAHDQIVEREVSDHQGTVVKSTGDGCLATFDGPARAVRCAANIREGLKTLGIELRAGVHTGEIERRGHDIAGLAVNVAARIMSLAGDSEILVSRTVRDLVVGSGLDFTNRGEHDLKGVPDRWTVLALT
jgi:class 3 adenylate cyclase